MLHSDLEIVPVSSWVVWAGAKALVGAGTQHFDCVIVAFNVEQKVVRRAPGIRKAGKRSVLVRQLSSASSSVDSSRTPMRIFVDGKLKAHLGFSDADIAKIPAEKLGVLA
jgi:hypothetical protein